MSSIMVACVMPATSSHNIHALGMELATAASTRADCFFNLISIPEPKSRLLSLEVSEPHFPPEFKRIAWGWVVRGAAIHNSNFD